MKTVLCVDDIKTNLFILEALFETHHKNSYDVISVTSGQDALDTLLSKKIDLILLDVMMPELDGFETAKLILSNKKTKDIPIIFLTAKKDQDTISKCYGVGGSDYIAKPYNEEELFVRMKFHLDLVEHKKKLQNEKLFTQNILDMQDNLVVVTDGVTVLKINKSVLDFYGLKSMEVFVEKYKCVCHTFERVEGYFSLAKVQSSERWVDVLLEELKVKDVLVLIKDDVTGKLNSFDIKAKNFGENYLVTLTNITSFDAESKNNEKEASFDALTSIYNRAKFNELLISNIENAKLSHGCFSLVMLDIDHFKDVNDAYGHLVGDNVLVQLSELVSTHIRESDIFARWGGEEFVLILTSVKIGLAERISENLRVKIEMEFFPEVNHITCSFGVTDYRDGDTLESIMSRADKALYDAKEGGRNRVCS